MVTLELLRDYRNQLNEIEKDYNTLTDSGKSNRKSLNNLYSRAHKIYVNLLWDDKLTLEPSIALRKEELMRDLSRFLESILIDLKWFQKEIDMWSRSVEEHSDNVRELENNKEINEDMDYKYETLPKGTRLYKAYTDIELIKDDGQNITQPFECFAIKVFDNEQETKDFIDNYFKDNEVTIDLAFKEIEPKFRNKQSLTIEVSAGYIEYIVNQDMDVYANDLKDIEFEEELDNANLVEGGYNLYREKELKDYYENKYLGEDLIESKEPLIESIMNNQQVKTIIADGSLVSIEREGIKPFRDWIDKQSYNVREVKEVMDEIAEKIGKKLFIFGDGENTIIYNMMVFDSRNNPDKAIFFAEDLKLFVDPNSKKYRELNDAFREKAKIFMSNIGVEDFNLTEDSFYYITEAPVNDFRVKATYVLLYTILEQIMLFDKENPGYIVVEDTDYYELEDDYPLDEKLNENKEDLKKDNDKQILLEIDDMLDDLEDDGEISNMAYPDSNQILLKAVDAVKNGTDRVYKYEPKIKEAFDIVKETYNLAKEGFRQFDYSPEEINGDAYNEYFSEEEQFYESLERLGITVEDLVKNNNLNPSISIIKHYFNDMWNILQGVGTYLHYNYPYRITE